MIGIYGGTFDPIHFGHLRTALEVKIFFNLSELRLIPCSRPAHRESPLTSAKNRLDMLSLAVKSSQDLVIDRRELDRDGYSYMVDTLKSIKQEQPSQTLLLFIGTDAFDGLMSWYCWQQLFDYAHVIVITRPNYSQKSLNSTVLSSKITDNYQCLKQQQQGYLFFQTVTQLDISATAIRLLIYKKRSPRYLLPDNVIEYIEKYQLYQE